jgi:O-succinylbenzoate synthase
VTISTHHYTLQPGPDPVRAVRGPRHGALLRVEFDDGTIGYADLHPWEVFGHAPLAAHLASLGTESPTPLAKLALRHARTDAAARRAGLSLFDGLPEVRSHALFTSWTNAPRAAFEQCVAAGYTAIKLKIGQDPEREAATLNQLADLRLRWRLDANASLTTGGEDAAATLCSAAVPGGKSIEAFLTELNPDIRTNIEFLEDPMPYESSSWMVLSEREKIPLALDWELPSTPPPWPGARVLVIKPAAQDAFPLALAAAHAGLDIVVTHSMDHPLGQAVALWTAMRLRQRHGALVRDGGLQAAGLYRPEAFGERIPCRGPHTRPPAGTGFGFDDLLAALPWTALSHGQGHRCLG